MTRPSSLVDLDDTDCELLLRRGVFGRLAMVAEGRLEIVPVNYTTRDGSIWIRTSEGSLLDRYADGVPLVFEVDHVDHERAHGWSVIARGHGERVLEQERSTAERREPGPPRWLRREDEVWIQLRWEELTGRRTGAGWDLTSGLPVSRVRG